MKKETTWETKVLKSQHSTRTTNDRNARNKISHSLSYPLHGRKGKNTFEQQNEKQKTNLETFKCTTKKKNQTNYQTIAHFTTHSSPRSIIRIQGRYQKVNQSQSIWPQAEVSVSART